MRTSLVGVGLGLCVAAQLHAGITFRTVAMTGDTVPGSPSVFIAGIVTPSPLSINNNGDLAFAVNNATGTQFIMREMNGVLSTVPTTQLLSSPAFNLGDSGHLACTRSNSLYPLWLLPPSGTMTELIGTSTAVPGVSGATFQALQQIGSASRFGHVSMTSTGACAFRSSLSAPGGVRNGQFLVSPGSITRLNVTAPTSDPLPRVTGVGFVSVNPSGQLAMTKVTTQADSTMFREIITGTSTNPVTSVSSGMSAFPAGPGLTFNFFGTSPDINSSGALVFTAAMLDAQNAQVNGVFLDNLGVLLCLARDGWTLNRTGGGTIFVNAISDATLTANTPIIGDGGHVVFPAQVRLVSGGPLVSALLRSEPGTGRFTVLAQEGQVVTAGTSTPITLGPIWPNLYVANLNEHGDVLMLCNTVPATISPVPFVIFADGSITCVARQGDQISLRGTTYTMTSVRTGSFSPDSGGADGRRRIWNDRREALFWAELTAPGGVSGQAVVVATVTNGPVCDSIDFNNDASVFDPQDIEAFLSVYSEGPCVPANATCNDIDFNNDTSLFDPMDINAFLSVYSEGPCV